MNNLRYTIRKILLENLVKYDKLVTLLCSENIDSINQALDLAEALGLVSNISYKLKSGGDVHRHIWEFEPIEEFMYEIESYWSTKEKTRTSYSESMHSIYPVGSTGKVGIYLSPSRR